MRWSEKQLSEFRSRRDSNVPATPFPASSQNARLALGRLPTGTMNKTEAAYDAHLWKLRHTGEILWHKFEAVKLRLADNTFYTCDFAVLAKDGILEMHEVKGGFWQDDARVKIKVAASIYPFRFIALMPVRKSKGGGWTREEF